jgi:hypothetical protein
MKNMTTILLWKEAKRIAIKTFNKNKIEEPSGMQQQPSKSQKKNERNLFLGVTKHTATNDFYTRNAHTRNAHTL